MEYADASLEYLRSCGMNSALLFATDVLRWFMASIQGQFWRCSLSMCRTGNPDGSP